MSRRNVGRGEHTGTVVVVDDERDVADLYSAYLEEHYDVTTVYSGRGALDAIDESVDVVLLDRRMPDRSGDEVVSEIRERGVDCPVVMVTAVEPDFDVVEMPIQDYLTKPVGRDDLESTVERQLVLDSYGARMEEYLQKRTKLRVLEEQKSPGELADSDRYNELRVVTESLRSDLQATIEEYDELELERPEGDDDDRS
jgi:DNA-binding response OmpR family regulator